MRNAEASFWRASYRVRGAYPPWAYGSYALVEFKQPDDRAFGAILPPALDGSHRSVEHDPRGLRPEPKPGKGDADQLGGHSVLGHGELRYSRVDWSSAGISMPGNLLGLGVAVSSGRAQQARFKTEGEVQMLSWIFEGAACGAGLRDERGGAHCLRAASDASLTVDPA
jgi:hypothetical protein